MDKIKEDFYEFPNRGKVLEFNPKVILTNEISKEKFAKWYLMFKDKMVKKNYSEYKPEFKLKNLKFFFSPRFFIKLWKRKRYVPKYIKHILKI